MKVEFDLKNVVLEGIPDSIEKSYVVDKVCNDATNILEQHLDYKQFITKIEVRFGRDFAVKSLFGIEYSMSSAYTIFAEVYLYVNNVGFYLSRLRVKEHFSYKDDDFHPRTNGLNVNVIQYLLDFKNLTTEEEKLFVVDNMKKIPFAIDYGRFAINPETIKMIDPEFYEKYKLLLV